MRIYTEKGYKESIRKELGKMRLDERLEMIHSLHPSQKKIGIGFPKGKVIKIPRVATYSLRRKVDSPPIPVDILGPLNFIPNTYVDSSTKRKSINEQIVQTPPSIISGEDKTNLYRYPMFQKQLCVLEKEICLRYITDWGTDKRIHNLISLFAGEGNVEQSCGGNKSWGFWFLDNMGERLVSTLIETSMHHYSDRDNLSLSWVITYENEKLLEIIVKTLEEKGLKKLA